jgi:transposase
MSLYLSATGRVHLMCGFTDMRNGVNGLFSLANNILSRDGEESSMFVFRGRRSDKIKILYWDGQGFCIFYKRLESGRFIWPKDSINLSMSISGEQLSKLLEGGDWRIPVRSLPPRYSS